MSYYGRFDVDMTNGRVYDLYLSRMDPLPQNELTQEEVNEWRGWAATCVPLIEHYTSHPNLPVSDTDTMLSQRVLPPVLSPNPTAISARSGKTEAQKERGYPPSLSTWNSFRADAEAFQQRIGN